MEFEDDAFVLNARAHGESGAIVELLTAEIGFDLVGCSAMVSHFKACPA